MNDSLARFDEPPKRRGLLAFPLYTPADGAESWTFGDLLLSVALFGVCIGGTLYLVRMGA